MVDNEKRKEQKRKILIIFNEKYPNYQREWYLKNRELKIDKSIKWNINNKIKRKKNNAIWFQNNKIKKREDGKEWRKNNLIKFKQQRREWFLKNKTKILLWHKNYKQSRYNKDIQFKLKSNLRNLLFNSLKLYSETGKIMSSTQYGINWKEVILHLIQTLPQDFEEWNKSNPDNKYSIDHIIPLSSFNLEDKEEIKKVFSPENHQWLKLKDNCSKGNKLDWIIT